MIVINGCNRRVTVLNIIMDEAFVQWSPIFSFNRALGKMLCNCRDIVVYWILGNSVMAESCNAWLISDIHDVMSIIGAGQVLGMS